jgi:glutathione S-transferase
MKLYDMVKAPNPRRVRMFLAEKGVEVPRVEVDIMAGQNLEPAYLAVNPRGLVPALVLDDGTVIDETMAICRYIEALHPEPNLFGRDALEIAQTEQWQRRVELDGFFQIGMIFRNTIPAYAGRSLPGTGGRETAQLPELAERGRLLGARFFTMLEQRLAISPFVAGGRFTVADITAYITVDFAKWVDIRLGDDKPATRTWYEAIRTRPSSRA